MIGAARGGAAQGTCSRTNLATAADSGYRMDSMALDLDEEAVGHEGFVDLGQHQESQ